MEASANSCLPRYTLSRIARNRYMVVDAVRQLRLGDTTPSRILRPAFTQQNTSHAPRLLGSVFSAQKRIVVLTEHRFVSKRKHAFTHFSPVYCILRLCAYAAQSAEKRVSFVHSHWVTSKSTGVLIDYTHSLGYELLQIHKKNARAANRKVNLKRRFPISCAFRVSKIVLSHARGCRCFLSPSLRRKFLDPVVAYIA